MKLLAGKGYRLAVEEDQLLRVVIFRQLRPEWKFQEISRQKIVKGRNTTRNGTGNNMRRSQVVRAVEWVKQF